MMSGNDDLSAWLSLFLLGEDDATATLERAAAPYDPDTAVQLLHHHLLAPRAFRILKKTGGLDSLGGPARESLRRGYLASIQRQEIALAEIFRLQQRFSRAGIRILFLKGALLAKRYYPFAEDRSFADIDFLVREEDRGSALELLREIGVEAGRIPRFDANAHKAEFSLRSNPAVQLDCHFALGHGAFRLHGVWERTHTIDGVDCLGSDDDYLFVLFHGLIQHRLQKIGWLLDLAQMERTGGLNKAAIASRAQDLYMGPALKIAGYWLSRYAKETSEPGNPTLDRFWHQIVTGKIEERPFEVARLRRHIYGSWSQLLTYALERRLARTHFWISKTLKSESEGPQNFSS